MLERYARVFNAVEVNSSFHRAHRPSTWQRWAESVPVHFRFAVKLPKAITHEARLVDAGTLIDSFARDVLELGDRLGPLLVQLPPALAFDAGAADRFFDALRESVDTAIACEPRHASWLEEEANDLLVRQRVARVAAVPALGAAAATPGGWRGLAYWRLHGSPVTYRSSYSDAALDYYATQAAESIRQGIETWCVFDNTAASAATADALALMAKL